VSSREEHERLLPVTIKHGLSRAPASSKNKRKISSQPRSPCTPTKSKRGRASDQRWDRRCAPRRRAYCRPRAQHNSRRSRRSKDDQKKIRRRTVHSTFGHILDTAKWVCPGPPRIDCISSASPDIPCLGVWHLGKRMLTNAFLRASSARKTQPAEGNQEKWERSGGRFPRAADGELAITKCELNVDLVHRRNAINRGRFFSPPIRSFYGDRVLTI
jgi:hypothetical protein